MTVRFLFAIIMSFTQSISHGAEPDQYKINKEIPALIEKSVLKALACYPELKKASIAFVFKKNLNSSVMQAQPVFRTLLKSRRKRKYRVYISSHFKLTNSTMPIESIPEDVMVGWIGHELGHIMDYESMSNTGIISFGTRYVTSSEFVKRAEITADTYAVNHGLGKYIIATKRFILNNADLPQAYKDKISRLYLSPDIIVEQVRIYEELLEKKNNP